MGSVAGGASDGAGGVAARDHLRCHCRAWFDALHYHDWQPIAQAAGGLHLSYFEHKASVVFPEPGTAEIALVYSTEGTWRPEAQKGDGRKVYTVEVSPAE